MKIKIPKWLADKNCLPLIINGEQVKETAKAIYVKVLNCDDACPPWKDYQEAIEYGDENAQAPCQGCLSRYGNDCAVAWLPKSQIEVLDK